MKKMIIAAFAVAFATAVQAASLKWGGNVCAPDGTTAVGTGSVAYLVQGSTAAIAAITTIFVNGSDYSAWTTDTGAKIVGSYTLTVNDAVNNYDFSSLHSIKGESDAGFYSVVLVNGGAGDVGLKGSYNYAGENTLVDQTSGAIVDLTISDGWTSKWIGNGGFESVEFKAAAIPEPTSGLLMLVGLAGLALRRRRA